MADLIRQLKENPDKIPVLPTTTNLPGENNSNVGSPVVTRKPRDRDRSKEPNVSLSDPGRNILFLRMQVLYCSSGIDKPVCL